MFYQVDCAADFFSSPPTDAFRILSLPRILLQSYGGGGGYGGGGSGYGGYQSNLLRHRGGYSSDQHLDYYAGGTGTSAYDTRKERKRYIFRLV